MDSFISREAAIDDLTHTLFYDQRDKATAKKLIATLPPADVVPVVRCKDCKYCEYGWCYEVISKNCCDHPKRISYDWYCADGERRE